MWRCLLLLTQLSLQFSCNLSFSIDSRIFMWSLSNTPLPQLSNVGPEYPPSEHGGRFKPNHSETELLQLTHLGKCSSLVLVTSLAEKCISWSPEPHDQPSYLCSSMEGNFTDESTYRTSMCTSFRSVTWWLRVKLNVAWVNDDNIILRGFVLWDETTECALRQSS